MKDNFRWVASACISRLMSRCKALMLSAPLQKLSQTKEAPAHGANSDTWHKPQGVRPGLSGLHPHLGVDSRMSDFRVQGLGVGSLVRSVAQKSHGSVPSFLELVESKMGHITTSFCLGRVPLSCNTPAHGRAFHPILLRPLLITPTTSRKTPKPVCATSFL